MDSVDLNFDDIRISLDLLKHRSVRLSQKMVAQLEGPPRLLLIVKWTFQLMFTDLLTLILILEGHQLPTILPIPDHFSFQILPSLLFHRPLSAWRSFCPFLLLDLTLGSISRPKRDSLAVDCSLLRWCSDSENDP